MKRQEIRDYVLDCIQPGEEYIMFVSDANRLEYMLETLYAAKWETVDRYGWKRAFSDWIWGLPTEFEMHFYDEEIERLLKRWEVPVMDGRLIETWNDTLWDVVVELCDINGVMICQAAY